MVETEPQVYLQGAFLPKSKAALSVEDRGALFGDGVYEVLRYHNGRGFAVDAHHRRLYQSLEGIRLAPPTDTDRLDAVGRALLERNATPDAKLYWQVTRGPAPRAHAFPENPHPTLLVMSAPLSPLDPETTPPRLAASLQPDRRWADPWIKSLMLLPNVLARQAARDAGADEAILHRDGTVTEGSATNVFLVRDGALITHPPTDAILHGITRAHVLALAAEHGLATHERAFSTRELLEADEVFVCGTTQHIGAVCNIDGTAVGPPAQRGDAGPVTARLHKALLQRIASETVDGTSPDPTEAAPGSTGRSASDS
jgi:D-alanine transaminase